MCVLCELAVRWIGIVVGVIWGLCVCCVLVGGCLYVKVCDLQLIGNLKKVIKSCIVSIFGCHFS